MAVAMAWKVYNDLCFLGYSYLICCLLSIWTPDLIYFGKSDTNRLVWQAIKAPTNQAGKEAGNLLATNCAMLLCLFLEFNWKKSKLISTYNWPIHKVLSEQKDWLFESRKKRKKAVKKEREQISCWDFLIVYKDLSKFPIWKSKKF